MSRIKQNLNTNSKWLRVLAQNRLPGARALATDVCSSLSNVTHEANLMQTTNRLLESLNGK